MAKIKRRHFISYTAGAAGALVGRMGRVAAASTPRPLAIPLPVAPGQVALNGWVKVSADNTVTIVMCQAEMGQGIHTGAAMLLAEEMDAAWEQVKLEQSTLNRIYNNSTVIADALPFQPDDNGYTKRTVQWLARKAMREVPGAIGTGGSSSVNDLWLPMREAGASARAALIAAAADLWKVPAAKCHADSGRVLHASGKSGSFGELAARAAQMPVPKNVALKDPSTFKLIGKPVRRLDNSAKIAGAAGYSIDALPPGLLYASG